ncbi:hypothetical protein GCM10025872_01740 [Barrientosiimonas endolithica]|uniref:Uncharacterized protein n=1 Tax=Barrientosiimonas endolithica TaxID=1535208 RepID=A0ABM8H6Q7_9MICO|nr:hypothetical protein GCM10025872_01740 [Barrientosiimonas endolithica]
MLGEPLGLVDVAHLGGRAAAAPLLAHQPELDPGLLQDLRDRPRDRRAVERRLAVDEQDRVAADRDVEAVGPVAHLVLADPLGPEHRLVGALVGAGVPAAPLGLVHPLVDGERAHGLDHVDRAGAEAIEVAGEKRVGTTQLARAALRAVDVVGRDVGDLELALLHRHDVGVEGGRGPRLVARHLHDRADLAAELVARGEAVVRRVVPLLDELAGARVGQVDRFGTGHGVGHLGQRRVLVAHAGRERRIERVAAGAGLDLGHRHSLVRVMQITNP